MLVGSEAILTIICLMPNEDTPLSINRRSLPQLSHYCIYKHSTDIFNTMFFRNFNLQFQSSKLIELSCLLDLPYQMDQPGSRRQLRFIVLTLSDDQAALYGYCQFERMVSVPFVSAYLGHDVICSASIGHFQQHPLNQLDKSWQAGHAKCTLTSDDYGSKGRKRRRAVWRRRRVELYFEHYAFCRKLQDDRLEAYETSSPAATTENLAPCGRGDPKLAVTEEGVEEPTPSNDAGSHTFDPCALYDYRYDQGYTWPGYSNS